VKKILIYQSSRDLIGQVLDAEGLCFWLLEMQLRTFRLCLRGQAHLNNHGFIKACQCGCRDIRHNCRKAVHHRRHDAADQVEAKQQSETHETLAHALRITVNGSRPFESCRINMHWSCSMCCLCKRLLLSSLPPLVLGCLAPLKTSLWAGQ